MKYLLFLIESEYNTIDCDSEGDVKSIGWYYIILLFFSVFSEIIYWAT
jgi:hypothetical protein